MENNKEREREKSALSSVTCNVNAISRFLGFRVQRENHLNRAPATKFSARARRMRKRYVTILVPRVESVVVIHVSQTSG